MRTETQWGVEMIPLLGCNDPSWGVEETSGQFETWFPAASLDDGTPEWHERWLLRMRAKLSEKTLEGWEGSTPPDCWDVYEANRDDLFDELIHEWGDETEDRIRWLCGCPSRAESFSAFAETLRAGGYANGAEMFAAESAA